MVDGVSGTDLYRVVLDPTPEPQPSVADDWHPPAGPGALGLGADAVVRLVGLPLRSARALAGTVRRSGDLARTARTTARGLGALATALVPAGRSSLTGPLSAHRRFAFARGSVDEVSEIRHTLGGTFNDVVLAAVTADFRTLLLSRGERPTPHLVRTLVPVNIRRPGEESIRDNRGSLMLARLPVDVADPVERLVAVRGEMERLKAEHEAEAGAALLRISGYEAFPAIASPVRLTARPRQRSVVTVTTNVPGPRVPLYALGRELVEIIPYVPIASTVRIGVSIFSYCRNLTFGFTGDYDGAAVVETLARGIEDGLAGLLQTARAARPSPSSPAPPGLLRTGPHEKTAADPGCAARHRLSQPGRRAHPAATARVVTGPASAGRSATGGCEGVQPRAVLVLVDLTAGEPFGEQLLGCRTAARGP